MRCSMWGISLAVAVHAIDIVFIRPRDVVVGSELRAVLIGPAGLPLLLCSDQPFTVMVIYTSLHFHH